MVACEASSAECCLSSQSVTQSRSRGNIWGGSTGLKQGVSNEIQPESLSANCGLPSESRFRGNVWGGSTGVTRGIHVSRPGGRLWRPGCSPHSSRHPPTSAMPGSPCGRPPLRHQWRLSRLPGHQVVLQRPIALTCQQPFQSRLQPNTCNLGF